MECDMENGSSILRPAPVSIGRMRRSTSVPDMRCHDLISVVPQIKSKSSLSKKQLDLSPLAMRRPSALSATSTPSLLAFPTPVPACSKNVPLSQRRSLPDSLPLEPASPRLPLSNRTLCRLVQEEDLNREVNHERSVMAQASLQKSFAEAMPSSPSPSIEISSSPTNVPSSSSVYCLSPTHSLSASQSPSSPRFLPRLTSSGSSPCASPTRRSFVSRRTPIIKTSGLDLKRNRRASSSDADDLPIPAAKRAVPFYSPSSRSGAASPLLLNVNGPLSPRHTTPQGWMLSESSTLQNSSMSDDERRWGHECSSPMDMGSECSPRLEIVGSNLQHQLTAASSSDGAYRRVPAVFSSSNFLALSREGAGRSEPIDCSISAISARCAEGEGSPMCISDSESNPWGSFSSPVPTSHAPQSS